jgi:hypothetical protein
MWSQLIPAAKPLVFVICVKTISTPIIQVLARPYLYVPRQLATFLQIGNGAVGSGIGIERDLGRDSLILHRLQKGLGRIPIPSAAEVELHGLADLVDGSIRELRLRSAPSSVLVPVILTDTLGVGAVTMSVYRTLSLELKAMGMNEKSSVLAVLMDTFSAFANSSICAARTREANIAGKYTRTATLLDAGHHGGAVLRSRFFRRS